jgi:flagellar basal-body rod modification protein FlgD
MSIDTITGTVSNQAAAAAQAAAQAEAARKPKQAMDSEVFMSLLVSQLRNQDPSSPMDTNEMISQTTQLAMMEKITEMTTTSTENFSLQMRIAAAGIVGKDVTYLGTDGVAVKGVASSVSFAGVVPTVSVGGKDIPLDLISGITTVPSTTPAVS